MAREQGNSYGENVADIFSLFLRLIFGGFLLAAGALKFAGGYFSFVESVAQAFDGSFLPAAWVKPCAQAGPILEIFLGLWLLSGIQPRIAAFMAAHFFFALAFGQMILQNWAVVSGYIICTVILAALTAMQAAKD